MDSFEDVTDGEPPSIDPYEVLGLERSATDAQVRSAYLKASLKHHPDKVPQDQRAEAHVKIQSVILAYGILKDPVRRKRYDTTGSTSESIVDSDGFSWSDFYREQYADAISSDAIAKFAEKYKNSEEEKDDVLVAYEEHEGDMDGIYESVMLSDVHEDDDRFRAIIDEAIESGDVPAFPAYTKETKKSKQQRLKAASRERREAEDYAKELGVHDKLFGGQDKKKGGGGVGGGGKDTKKKGADASSEDALAALIRKRQTDRGTDFLDRLAEKYGAKAPAKKKGKKGGKAAVKDDEDDDDDGEDDEPSEEAFQAAAARLGKRKATASASSSKKRAKR